MFIGTIQPLNPVAFELGPLTVYWYGLLIGLGALIGYLIANREAKKRGMPADMFADLLLFALPAAIVGARIYYVIFRWEQFAENPVRVFYIWEGGLAIHGGLIGALLTAYIYAKIKGLSFWKIADIAAPSIILGQAIGRWGNFVNQEVYGGEVSRSFLENLMLPDFIINQMYIQGAYHHPTFLYESVWNIIGFILLLWLRRVNLRRGELFISYAIWYSVGRFFIEGIRTDNLLIFDVIRTAQIVSIITVIGGIIILIYRRKTGLSASRYLDDGTTSKSNKQKRGKSKKKK
ncbi:prolipoprotein diacylglyceryl transferase [Salipaludibacillus agaradhaerens]|uniref:Phosphatidylglycerol--prolipoprotein diacylglyceryl transferase n=1 Tax=Salipaludibacillus agaradhaerens TaxID=76935 RepID=A0A9Q4FXF8_SALAG|nr:prolipoprotein diacylglyceryl transferase [Salipaludibacillus agaradhaerens]MCR6095132.1 prolipoprotein diacylglyceryl transferase [Salipaludibacillus agaradhaerens]MCR6115310.1 prolipoprotein diacylglyceryl transferase [Salipaludibacillus agaradhaerens]